MKNWENNYTCFFIRNRFRAVPFNMVWGRGVTTQGPMTPIREKGDWPLNPFWEKGDGSKNLGRRETAKKFREKGDGLYNKNGPI